jgi:hypothetical protein
MPCRRQEVESSTTRGVRLMQNLSQKTHGGKGLSQIPRHTPPVPWIVGHPLVQCNVLGNIPTRNVPLQDCPLA